MVLEQTILGIDIGSTKICAMIALCKDGIPHIIGTGFHKSQGLKKGSITNIEQASRAIKNSLNDAKRVAGANINKAVISISGAYTKSTDSSGIVNIPNNEIGIKEINRVIQTALYNASIPQEYEVIHILPYNFKLDDQDFIEDPMGMTGNRLEVSVRIITVQKSSLGNLKKAIRSAGIEIENIILASYASSIATLTDDEKNLGVACIDMGGSTCELMIHVGNSLRYNDFLGVGSNHITNDLAMALHTPQTIAEQVKMQYGSLLQTGEDLIEIPTIGGDDNNKHQVSLTTVHNVVYARVEETLMILSKSLEDSNLKDQLGSGVVLTGGMVKLEGIRELASALFSVPVRFAKPIEIDGLFADFKGPEYSTAIGLILYASGKYTNYEIDSEKRIRHKHEKLEDEIVTFNKNMNLINPLNNIGNKPQVTLTAANAIPKNASDIKQDLTGITEIKKITTKTDNVFVQFWQKLTQMF